jgi:hypothetical protein
MKRQFVFARVSYAASTALLALVAAAAPASANG